MTQLQEYEDDVRHIVREITRDFFIALLVVTFVAYALGLLVGAATCSRKCGECGKQLKALTRPVEVE